MCHIFGNVILSSLGICKKALDYLEGLRINQFKVEATKILAGSLILVPVKASSKPDWCFVCCLKANKCSFQGLLLYFLYRKWIKSYGQQKDKMIICCANYAAPCKCPEFYYYCPWPGVKSPLLLESVYTGFRYCRSTSIQKYQ